MTLLPSRICRLALPIFFQICPQVSRMSTSPSVVPITQSQWRQAFTELSEVPNGGKIPAFFFGHGSPMLAYPDSLLATRPQMSNMGPHGPLATFLCDFGPFLLEKYKPKAIVVLSAHWETDKERLVTDYGDENPLLMDYFGFPPELYNLKFKSRGNSALTSRIVECFQKANIPARSSPISEARGRDGRGHVGPGLDHGVFVPFRIMFSDEFMEIPIVQVSIDESLSPEKNWAIGKALDPLRSEGILILSGGLTIHSFEDFSSFDENTAKPIFKSFSNAVTDAVQIEDADERRKALYALVSHAGFRKAHPREEHFIPIYAAAGAGEVGKSKLLSGLYGAQTVAFGIDQ